MNTQQRITLAQLDTQAFSLMGRLHVILRRETGRVTDIEYMRHDPDYCRHVLELAEHMENAALQEICTRLREIFFGTGGLFMMQVALPLLAPRTPVSTAPSLPASPDAAAPEAEGQAYVGRLR